MEFPAVTSSGYRDPLRPVVALPVRFYSDRAAAAGHLEACRRASIARACMDARSAIANGREIAGEPGTPAPLTREMS